MEGQKLVQRDLSWYCRRQRFKEKISGDPVLAASTVAKGTINIGTTSISRLIPEISL
jgi:hypothetical protein